MLLPRGVKRVADMSWFLAEAIAHALAILSWYENYVNEEIPPENLWDDSEGIEKHFAKVREKKEAERSGEKYDPFDEENSDMVSNELASVFKK